MARTPKAKPAPAPEPEETDEGGAVRGPGEMHELFSEFLKEETGVDVSPEAIFLVTSKRTAFRKSEAYLEYAEALDKAREEAAVEKEKRAAARAQAQAEPQEDEEAKPARRRGRAKAATEEAPAADEAKKVTPIRGRRKAAAATDTADEAQAETAPAKPAARRRRSAPANF